MKLYGYWRSSAAYRVRIAMHLKSIEFDSIPVHLVKDGGQQHQSDYVAMNPNHLVPTLVDNELVLNQSMAIIDYLEQKYPDVPLYPNDIAQRAIVQAMALDIACEVHPINNLRVQQYLVNELSATEQQKKQWVDDWISLGFSAFEQQLAKYSGRYCFGDSITIADLCLVPQVYNAVRFGVNLSPFPNIKRVVDNCNQHSAFVKALPENQDDAV
ncbi:maleylacetoacetate isomerase [Thalassotalea sp. M1531]|uniref:Maleylacetoacetate isomerase n=1 Tax=Thalassotalea algicola TaxID=2716224 RepID=A0A7Y0LF24_9GAMM|nr:maleylacetoacetate isomerase [Thalassotalea algicola]NMP33358.1 maleylacetoacetate isomerase [Thalassotalea algicola]